MDGAYTSLRRRPGSDVASPLADAKFAGGDRVICFEWFGDSPPPAPKWRRNLRTGFSQESYIARALRQMIDASAPIPEGNLPWIGNLTDGELLHNIWGVKL